MAILVDTSVLGRLANRADASYPIAKSAVAELHRRGEMLHVTAQNFVEFLNFATRPVSTNGLGLAAPAALGLQATFEAAFPLLDETPDIFPAWKRIVQVSRLETHCAGARRYRKASPRRAPHCNLPRTLCLSSIDVQRFALRSLGRIWSWRGGYRSESDLIGALAVGGFSGSVIAVSTLPLGVAVEIEAVFELEE